MNLFSLQFWLLPLLLILYLLIPEKNQRVHKLFLLVASLGIYISWRPISVLFMIWVAGISYSGGLLLRKRHQNRLLIWTLAILILAPLCFLKIRPVLYPTASLFFPLGLSFYTLQALGYLFDVYRDKIEPVHDALDYSLFIGFFPQISSGPISRASNLIPQLSVPPRPSSVDIGSGLRMIIIGAALKLVVADRLGLSVDAIFVNYQHYSGADCLLAVVLYSFQLYADFSGYSLIAIGIARCFGIHLIDNFRQPYLAVGIGDFWRRWHISLSQWLRDYVYIPLGGNRCSSLRCYFNILVTFLVSGLWHGVAWNFIFWGLFLGLGSMFEKAVKWNDFVSAHHRFRWAFRALTFIIICFSWIFFRSPSIPFFGDFIRHSFADFGSLSLPDIGGATIVMWVMGILLVVMRDFYLEFKPLNHRVHPVWGAVECSVLIALILAFGVLNGGQFIYVNF